MNTPAPLDRERIRRAFGMMALDLGRQGVRGEILLAGGAVMALVYDSNRVTRDVDGVIRSGHGPVVDAAHRVASELQLPRGWLNEGVSTYLSEEPEGDETPVFDHPALAVMAVSARHLFAMKARAARASDVTDLRTLAGVLHIRSVSDALEIVADLFPDDALSSRASALLEDMFTP